MITVGRHLKLWSVFSFMHLIKVQYNISFGSRSGAVGANSNE